MCPAGLEATRLKLTAAQQQAVECPSPCLQIAACAGSGKTEVLARRVVWYLNQGIGPDAIVAFTFTEKAAEEGGTSIRVDNDQEELRLFKEQINRWVYGIGHGSFSPSSEEACPDCDYGILCGRVS